MVDHQEILRLGIFHFENLLSFDFQQFDGHAVNIGFGVIPLPSVGKTNQSAEYALAEHSMPQSFGKIRLDDESLGHNRAVSGAARGHRIQLPIAEFLDIPVDRHDLVNRGLFARQGRILAEPILPGRFDMG